MIMLDKRSYSSSEVPFADWYDPLQALCLLKSPFLLPPLMLRLATDTLLGVMSVLVSLLLTLRTSARSRAALQLEILALRHQLQVLQRSRPRRLRLAKPDRWLWVVLSRVLTGWRTALVIVKPETVIAWHRQGFRLVGPEESAAHGATERAR
jgi:hypothetical protein